MYFYSRNNKNFQYELCSGFEKKDFESRRNFLKKIIILEPFGIILINILVKILTLLVFYKAEQNEKYGRVSKVFGFNLAKNFIEYCIGFFLNKFSNSFIQNDLENRFFTYFATLENNEFIKKSITGKKFKYLIKNSIEFILSVENLLFLIGKTFILKEFSSKDGKLENKLISSLMIFFIIASNTFGLIVFNKFIKKKKEEAWNNLDTEIYNFESCHDNIRSFGIDAQMNIKLQKSRNKVWKYINISNLSNAFFRIISMTIFAIGSYKVLKIYSKKDPHKFGNKFENWICFISFLAWDIGFNIYDSWEYFRDIKDPCQFMYDLKVERKNGKKIDKIYSIEIKNLNFSYENDKENKILNNINLDLKNGMTVAFVGQSGSGKSTLSRIIATNFGIENGIFFNSKEIKDINLKSLRDQTIYVTQNNDLFAGNILDNMNNPLLNDEMNSKEKILIIKESLEFVNLWDEIMLMPKKFFTKIEFNNKGISGGQKQRLLLAANLTKAKGLKSPKISLAVFDEATSAIPKRNSDILLEKIMNTFKEQIVIIVDHSGFVAPRADLVVFFHKGKIYKGKHEDLLKENILYKDFFEGVKIKRDEI